MLRGELCDHSIPFNQHPTLPHRMYGYFEGIAEFLRLAAGSHRQRYCRVSNASSLPTWSKLCIAGTRLPQSLTCRLPTRNLAAPWMCLSGSLVSCLFERGDEKGYRQSRWADMSKRRRVASRVPERDGDDSDKVRGQ